MTAKARAALASVALAVGFGLAALVLNEGDSRYPTPPETERLLYVRSPETATRLALSFRGVLSDVYWIRAIQHFGRDLRSERQAGRFELLQPLLDLTTTLDPYFGIAYRFGAVFLAEPAPMGPGQTDAAVALLKKGLTRSPGRWQYAYDIGFVYYLDVGNYQAAADWFQRASDIRGAPEWLRPLAATTAAQGGDRQGARRLLNDLAQSEEVYLRKDAIRGLAQLDALDAIDQLQALVDAYRAKEGAYPANWVDLVHAGLLRGIPADDARVPFAYDAATHRVGLSRGSPLGPLPTGLKR